MFDLVGVGGSVVPGPAFGRLPGATVTAEVRRRSLQQRYVSCLTADSVVLNGVSATLLIQLTETIAAYRSTIAPLLNSIGSVAPATVRRASAVPLVLQPAVQRLIATLAGRPVKRQACRLPLPALTLAGSPPHAYEHAPAPTAKGPAVTSRQQAAGSRGTVRAVAAEAKR
ncbi:hypothetical protein ACFYZ9_19635 [Streptomyces sp. NPDC001691]|uniref:hypothetical protein n=1 Tax=Streptomyces sp. NPDC001691 TaxID=3364600 RepID=UPI0036D1281D